MSKSKKPVVPQVTPGRGRFLFPGDGVYEGEYVENLAEGTRVREGQGSFVTPTRCLIFLELTRGHMVTVHTQGNGGTTQ